MVILRSQNKITDFFMILAWAGPFNDVPVFSSLRRYHFDYYPIYMSFGWIIIF